MKIIKFIIFFVIFILLFHNLSLAQSITTNNSKDSNTNTVNLTGVWLDDSIYFYDLYRDSNLTQDFRGVIQSVCDYIEPSTVISQYYSFDYTDIIDSQAMYDNRCQLKFGDYDNAFAAKCCNIYSPDAYSASGLDYGQVLEFDILINKDSTYTWTTGNFNTPGVWDREHTMRHEVAHGVGLAHNSHSSLMISEENYNENNPERNITIVDRYNYHAIYNPPEIIKPLEQTEGFCELLLDHGKQIRLEAIKPEIVETDSAELDFHLLNEDSTFNCQIYRYSVFNTTEQKYIYDWVLDTLDVENKAYILIAFYTGFNPKTPMMYKIPHVELNVRFSNLTLKSPEYNKEYSVYAPLQFEVFGKSEKAYVSIMDIYNIGTVEYLLEKKGLIIDPDIFSETTTLADSLKFKKDLSTIQGLETGD